MPKLWIKQGVAPYDMLRHIHRSWAGVRVVDGPCVWIDDDYMPCSIEYFSTDEMYFLQRLEDTGLVERPESVGQITITKSGVRALQEAG